MLVKLVKIKGPRKEGIYSHQLSGIKLSCTRTSTPAKLTTPTSFVHFLQVNITNLHVVVMTQVGSIQLSVHTARPLYNNIQKPAVIIAACLNINGNRVFRLMKFVEL